MGEIIKFSNLNNSNDDINKLKSSNNDTKEVTINSAELLISMPSEKISKLPTTPLIIESAYYSFNDEKEIIIGPTTELIEKYAFWGCITQNIDKTEKISVKGNLEKIYIPYGIIVDLKATNNLLIDYNYLFHGIPTWATIPQKNIEFIIYNSQTRDIIYSIEYPIWMVDRFGKDYNDIIEEKFDFDNINPKDPIIFKIYNKSKKIKKRKR